MVTVSPFRESRDRGEMTMIGRIRTYVRARVRVYDDVTRGGSFPFRYRSTSARRSRTPQYKAMVRYNFIIEALRVRVANSLWVLILQTDRQRESTLNNKLLWVWL